LHHEGRKAYWLRPLRRDAYRLLSQEFDRPLISTRIPMHFPDLNRLDISWLMTAYEEVPDPRDPRGVGHKVPQILGIATLAMLWGASSLFAIGQVAAGLLGADQAPEIHLEVMLEEDKSPGDALGTTREPQRPRDEEEPPSADTATVTDDPPSAAQEAPVLLPAVAVDGKMLRGARTSDKRQVHLLSAFTFAEGVTIAQRAMEDKSNEITAFRPLLEGLELTDVVLTADAMHTQRDHARFLIEENSAHFVAQVKADQPRLLETPARAFAGVFDVHETYDKAHGLIEHRYYTVVPITE